MEQTLPSSEARQAELEGRFVSALPEIERTIRFVARRNRLSPSEADDFSGEVKLSFIEHNYQVLASFQGHSSLRTYLTIVVQRLFLDYRRKLWGKWRPSAEAQRRGPVAVRLEAFLYRDGLSFDESAELLRTNLGMTESREALAEIAQALPARTSRRMAGEEHLETLAAGELASPEVQVEGATTLARLQAQLVEAIEALPPQDRLVLRLRFEDGVSVADIARTLKLDQKQLYRRVDGLLLTFRKSLEGRGLGWSEVERVIERGQCHLCLPKIPAETAPLRPSPPETQV